MKISCQSCLNVKHCIAVLLKHYKHHSKLWPYWTEAKIQHFLCPRAPQLDTTKKLTRTNANIWAVVLHYYITPFMSERRVNQIHTYIMFVFYSYRWIRSTQFYRHTTLVLLLVQVVKRRKSVKKRSLLLEKKSRKMRILKHLRKK